MLRLIEMIDVWFALTYYQETKVNSISVRVAATGTERNANEQP